MGKKCSVDFCSGQCSLVKFMMISKVVCKYPPVRRGDTPPKINMSPENQWFEDVFPIEIVPF